MSVVQPFPPPAPSLVDRLGQVKTGREAGVGGKHLNTDVMHDFTLVTSALQPPFTPTQVDYEGVMATKARISRMVYDRFGHETVDSTAFKVRRRPPAGGGAPG